MRSHFRMSGAAGSELLRRVVSGGWAGALTLALGLGEGPTPAPGPDTTILNRATASVKIVDGSILSVSAEAAVRLGQAAGVRLAPPQSAVLEPGASRVFTHRLENLGTAVDRFTLAASAPSGWTVEIILDTDGDGALGETDERVSGPVVLERGAGATLFLRVTAPATAADAPNLPVELRATSERDPTVGAAVLNQVTVVRLAAAPRITKTVDRTGATAGDTLLYAIAFGNDGNAPARPVLVSDLLPSQLRYLAGSLRLDGAVLSDSADGDAWTVASLPEGQRLEIRLDSLEAGATRELRFRAVVVGGATGEIVNVARLDAEGFQIVSPPVRTGVQVAAVGLQKTLLGPVEVAIGDEVSYRIRWSTGAIPVRAAILTDTLPESLRFVTADGAVQATGQIVRWSLGDLEANSSGSIVLVTRAAAAAAAVVNRATVRGLNADEVVASAAAVRIVADTTPPLVGRLEITKRAGAVEARIGDRLSYQVVLRNGGEAELRGIVVRDILPAGVELIENRVSGADSVRIVGREARFWVAGPLTAGEEHVITYSVTVLTPGRQSSLTNIVSAEAEGGVHSDTARATVRMRRGFAGESRTVLGKVWLDTDGNGRQDAGEPGIAGVQVWSADGEMVITDAHGRYSFRNLRPGTHALRLDTAALGADRGLARAEDMIALVRLDGWTTPVADFRVVPRAVRTGLLAGPAVPALLEQEPPPADTLSAPRVTPLRSEAERDEDAALGLLEGGRVRILHPGDGSLTASNRLSLIVQGDAGAPVRLFRGTELLVEGLLRPDGRLDFVGIELERGPQALRVWMRNGWGNEVWDSVAVHRSGSPHAMELVGEVQSVRSDAPATQPVLLRVTDQWGVAIPGAVVTLEAEGARIDVPDADRTSVGVQIAAARDGIIRVPLHGGEKVGPGELRAVVAGIRTSVPLRVLPSTRELIATGAAQVGVGAASESFGAVTIRGALDAETSITLTYDSRRRDQQYDFFGRGYDPLDESRYPTFGDASERRVYASSTQTLTARLERGYDWLQFGDLDTGSFGGEGRLASHRRAVTGLGSRVTTGAAVWQAYASLTDQALSAMQLRGDGTSGPYGFGGSIRPGTDRIAVEVRAADNASEVLSRQELQRFVDYQIDYSTGTVFLFRPLPSTDAAGNHIFLVGMLERRTGDAARFVGGARMDLDAGSLLGLSGGDSLGIFVLGVHDAATGEDGRIGGERVGGGVRFQSRGLRAAAEMLHAGTPESGATAARAVLGWSSANQRARVEGEWTRVGAGFDPTVDPRLAGGLTEARFTGELAPTEGARLRLTHSRQRFEAYGVERSSTLLHTKTNLLGREIGTEGGMVTTSGAGSVSGPLLTGKLTAPFSSRFTAWVEGAHSPSRTAEAASSDQVGVGAGYRVTGTTQIELVQRWIGIGGDSAAAAVTSMKVRTVDPFGGQLWGGVDHAIGREASAGVLGWSPTAALRGGWSMHALAERRFGIGRVPLTDPVRALPFAQPERDRWSLGAGVQWTPVDSAGRFSLRSEIHRGELSEGHRAELTGEAPLGNSTALLGRVESWGERRSLAGAPQESMRQRALAGLAFRPAESNALNVLARVEWRRTLDPVQGAQFGRFGDDRRLIAAGDAIWAPGRRAELAARYATRWSFGEQGIGGGGASEGLSQYTGARIDLGFTERVSGRLDGRLLVGAGSRSRASLAPALLVSPGGGVQLETGYRFGDLRDADFAAEAGAGFYATMAVRFSEGSFARVNDFWRERVKNQR
jgi:uncharacterized repeat protein (TIGR01451 family)